MFRNRTFKVLSNLILLAVFCTGQVAAAPNNNATISEHVDTARVNSIQPQADLSASTVPLLNIASLAIGSTALYHTCALTLGGGVKCWGLNYYGALGDGTHSDHPTEIDVSGLTSGVSAVVVGFSHTCALTLGGGVKCWGDNSNGKLGDDSFFVDSTIPVNVFSLTSGVSAIAAGEEHTCAVLTDGTARCWGDNHNGQVGDGTRTDRIYPRNVVGLVNASAIAAGGYHTCALTTSGGVKCWGNNSFGQIGDGDGTIWNRLTPVDVSGLTSGVSAISAGGYHTCALTTSGGVKCWGSNDDGQLGDGTTIDRLTPVDVSGLTSGVSAIAAGGEHTCALMTSGGVKCWGDNYNGELGDGTTIDRLTPVDVSGLTSGVSAIAAGYTHTRALMTSGGVKCWGRNQFGQLGDGTYTQRLTPVDVVSSSTPPTVSSITRANINPTNAASVNFTVTFSEIVTGVDFIAPFNDFALTTTGVTGATITAVNVDGFVNVDGLIGTVTVNTGSGNGTIRLDVIDNDSIMDTTGNLLNGGFTTGEAYTVTKVYNLFLPLILR